MVQRLVARRRLVLLAAALALLLGPRVSPATAAATTIRVPADVATIQGAIDAALDGDLILVSPGVYSENLTISGNTITLASEFYNSGNLADISSTIIDGGGGGATIIVNSTVGPDTTIMGFTIRNATNGLRPFGKLNILNNVITATSDGIDFEGGGGVVRNNMFENNSDDVITFSAGLRKYAVAGVITFTGVHQTDPLGTFGSSYGDSSSASATVPTGPDDLLFGVFGCETCGSVSFSSPGVEQWNEGVGTGPNTIGAGGTVEGAGSISVSLGKRDHWAMGAVAIRPVP